MKRTKGYIVTIDGPSGAGKSTVSRLLSESIRGVLLDTGAMYRGVALLALESGIRGPTACGALARRLTFDIDKNGTSLAINRVDYGERLRGEHIGTMASHISQYPSVRRALMLCQRFLVNKIVRHRPVVVEGRDIGTVVFPRAPFKFFVTARPRVRAKRRYDQLVQNGVTGITIKAVMKEMARRDKQDKNRKMAPLRCPHDAVVVDTSTISIPQVVIFLKGHIENKLN